MTERKPTAVDLFCGAGGMSLGFEQAGFEILAAFDREDFNVSTHKANFPHTATIKADLGKEDGDSLRRSAGLIGKNIDLVFGGPPCQGFSYGGRYEADDARNRLVFEFGRLVLQFRPKYFVMENVKGFLADHAGDIRKSFIRSIKRGGYRVVEPIKVLNAADFGVPQRRWRTFVLGYRKDLNGFEYPEPISTGTDRSNRIGPTVRDAIGDLPDIERYDDLFESDVLPEALPATSNRYAQIMRGEVVDQDDKSGRTPNVSASLTGFLRTRHSKDIVKRFKKTRQGDAEKISRYFRLAWDDVAPTIRAGTGSDRGSHTAPRPIHPDAARCITTREAARLHSLPDWFTFHATRWHGFRQIGNSVPPLLARAVAAKVVEFC